MKRENTKTASHPTVYNRVKRKDLRCSICPPNRGENQKCHKKHGVKKPKYKDHKMTREELTSGIDKEQYEILDVRINKERPAVYVYAHHKKDPPERRVGLLSKDGGKHFVEVWTND